ncbi:ABC transporter substrate-binding protein [Rubritepida flocculans]|uniref:ABC transporter substrate-binding protein n=1 Tax=Rubritepida flocculans TaxID=182403 RepID=UPI0004223F04|nr:ABC transporter substrate-binding protein [Rubritepida flocculans]
MRRRLAFAALPLLAAPRALRAQAAQEWRVGAVLPLSGAQAPLGDEALRGLEMAVEERNAAGGRPVRLLRADATEPGAALAEARRLIQQERCTVLFGSVSAPVGLAAMQAAEALETPYVELASPAEVLGERGGRFFVRSAPRASAFGAQARRAMTGLLPGLLSLPLDAMRVALLHETGVTSESLAGAVEGALREAGAVIAERLSHPPRSPEWPALAQRLRAAGVSVVIHAAGEADAAALLRALADAAWRPRAVIGLGAGWGLAEFGRALGAAAEAVFALDVPPIESSPAWAQGARRFAEAYQRRWGGPPRSALSLAVFAGARVVLGLPALERAAVRPALVALDQPAGALPNGWGWRLDERGQNLRAAPVLLQWQAGRPVAVFPPEAAAAAPV